MVNTEIREWNAPGIGDVDISCHNKIRRLRFLHDMVQCHYAGTHGNNLMAKSLLFIWTPLSSGQLLDGINAELLHAQTSAIVPMRLFEIRWIKGAKGSIDYSE